jgi:2-methylcitrate dehydratase PrpD
MTRDDGSTIAQGTSGLPLTRRDALRQAGLLVAAAALRRAPSEAQTQSAVAPSNQITRAELPVSDTMLRLSAYMSQARDRALPDDVLEKAKQRVLDTIAAMVSGSELHAGRSAIKFARDYGGKPISMVVCDTIEIGPIEAALANAALAHADETDDYGPAGHPGCCAVPAALAIGEQVGIDGVHFLRAVALGYDIGTRVWEAITPAMRPPAASGLPVSSRSGYSGAGVFNATAAAGCAAGLSAEQMRWALGYAAQQCAGIESFPRDPDRNQKAFLFAGMPTSQGVTAVVLVRAGWTGVNDMFSGTDNFLKTYFENIAGRAGAPSPNPDLLVRQLGERWDVTRSSIKRFPIGSPIRQSLYAMEALLSQQPIDPSQVQEVIVRYAAGSITDNSGPSDINVQHALALMLTDKRLTFRSSHDVARMKDPAILRLRARTRFVAPRPQGTPPDQQPPLLQIVLTDGTRLVHQDVPPPLGTAANPMTTNQVIHKARELMTPVLGATQTAAVVDRVMSLEKVQNIRELRRLLQAKRASGPPRLSEYPSGDGWQGWKPRT